MDLRYDQYILNGLTIKRRDTKPPLLHRHYIEGYSCKSGQCTIYSVEGEWEYFFAHFRKGVKSFKKGLRMKFGYLEGQFIDFMEDSGG